MYFQHDGYHHPKRFAPLAANTGFYYVRHNARTEYFFSVFIRMGDLVLNDKSHQVALTVLAKEHMSLRGLRVKVLDQDNDLFLSGYHYHADPRLLQKGQQGSHNPYLFHANWMEGSMKRPVLQSTQNWFVRDDVDECFATSLHHNTTGSRNFYESCCSAEPISKQ